jgi:rhodanese-related sulfurtransferase
VLDVREQKEWDEARIPGSSHLPYHDIQDVPAWLDGERAIAVICASGQRSAVGASLLKAHGALEVIHVVDGGVPRWERLGFPIER